MAGDLISITAKIFWE